MNSYHTKEMTIEQSNIGNKKPTFKEIECNKNILLPLAKKLNQKPDSQAKDM